MTIEEIQHGILDDMVGMDDWLDRYEYLIHLGDDIREDASLRKEEYAIAGCQSQVWVRTTLQDGRMRIDADSDARITRGIIALLRKVLDGHPPEQITAAELFVLDKSGLSSNLSPSRGNGLKAIVTRIRQDAGAFCGGNTAVPGGNTG